MSTREDAMPLEVQQSPSWFHQQHRGGSRAPALPEACWSPATRKGRCGVHPRAKDAMVWDCGVTNVWTEFGVVTRTELHWRLDAPL